MTTPILYNETTSNGKYHVMTAKELTGKGIKKYGVGCIHQHKLEIYNNLNGYWVSASAYEQIKKEESAERTNF